jgi:hypothetical protein
MAYLLAFNRHAFPDGSALATLTGKYTIPPLHNRSQQVLLALYFPSFVVFHPVAGLAHPMDGDCTSHKRARAATRRHCCVPGAQAQ